ncbi:hypothetical protein D9M71_567650 [compost metagenome]
MEILDVRPDLQQRLFGFLVVGRLVAVGRQPQVVEGDRQHLRRVVDDRHATFAEFPDIGLIEKQAPGPGNVDVAEDRLDLLDVVTNARGAPHVGITVLVAGIVDLELFHQHRVKVAPARQLAPVEFLDGPGLDQAREEMVRRADHVIPGVAGHQLRFQHFVAVMDVVGGLDPGFFAERGQGVVGDVAVPVGNVHGFIGVGGGAQR